jgi:hypothetical protein
MEVFMKTFAQFQAEKDEKSKNSISDKEVDKFKKAMDAGKNTSGLYGNYRKHPKGHVTYTFNGYMGGAIRKKNGVIHHAQDVDEDNIDWKDKSSGITSHPSVDNLIKFQKKIMDPDFHDNASKEEKDSFFKAHEYKHINEESLDEISDKLLHRYVDKATKYLDKNSRDYMKHDDVIDDLRSTRSGDDERARKSIENRYKKMNTLDVLGKKRQRSLEKALQKDTRNKPNPYR